MKLNVVLQIGNLVRDAEVVKLPNGKTKQIFTIAINDDYKKVGTEEWIPRPYFVNCYVIGKVYMDMKKGKRVLVNGKWVTKSYETDDKKKKTVTLLEVYALDFVEIAKIDGGESQQENNVKTKDDEGNIVPF